MSTASHDTSQAKWRGFYVGIASLMAAIAVIGFWPSYWGPLLSGTLDLHWLLHVHGIVFTVWMAVFVTQAALAYRGRIDLHVTLGKSLGAGWALLVITVGLAATFVRAAPGIGDEFNSLAEFLTRLPIPLGDIVAFVLLFGSGIVLTDRPAAHKRLMILATVALLAAPVARLLSLGASSPSLTFLVLLAVVPLVPALLAIGYDQWSRGRVHSAYWVGMLVLLANASKYLWLRGEGWTDLAAGIAETVKAALLPLF